MIVVTMLNQKGGVGKTSCTHHLAGALALQLGRRVLLLDNDPQGSLSQGFWGPTPARRIDPAETIAALYAGDSPFPEQVIKPSGIAGIDIVPGSKAATDYNVPRPGDAPEGRQHCIRSFLADVEGYDVALIDCPPNLHLCSWAALVASDYIVVPVMPEDYGAQGLADVQESVAMVQAGPNPSLALLGYLLTKVSATKAVHKLYEATIRRKYGADVFESRMMDAVAYVEAIMERKPIAATKPRSAPAKGARAIAEELLCRARAREIPATLMEAV